MMRRHWTALLVILLVGIAFLPAPVKAHEQYYYKLIPGMPFVYFDLEDIYHQRWVSTYLRGRPVVILTGHRYVRYEILKWAEMLKREFGLPGAAHLLWVVNLSHFPWSTSRTTIIDQWRSFGPPIPLLADWSGVLGKALRINYNVPNIIAIDAEGRFALHEMHTFSPEAYAGVSARIRALLTAAPGMAKPVTATPFESVERRLTPEGRGVPSGRKGFSE